MGRKAGGKNFANFTEDNKQPVLVTVDERNSLPDIFTSIKKDFISIQDMVQASGLSYEVCAKIVREIKAVSDVFHISGFVHRTDYYLYLSRRLTLQTVEDRG